MGTKLAEAQPAGCPATRRAFGQQRPVHLGRDQHILCRLAPGVGPPPARRLIPGRRDGEATRLAARPMMPQVTPWQWQPGRNSAEGATRGFEETAVAQMYDLCGRLLQILVTSDLSLAHACEALRRRALRKLPPDSARTPGQPGNSWTAGGGAGPRSAGVGPTVACAPTQPGRHCAAEVRANGW